MSFTAKVRGILGRDPTSEEMARLRRLREILEIKDNDALFSVLIAFESYLELYSHIPKSIEVAALRAREISAKSGSDAVAESVAIAKRDLATSIASAVHLATQSTGALRWRWILQGAAAALAALVLTFGVAWVTARDAGRAEALSEVHGLAVWAETPDGRAAKAWSDSGELGALLRCDRPGWRQQKTSRGDTLCSPDPEKKKGGSQYGWLLPSPTVR